MTVRIMPRAHALDERTIRLRKAQALAATWQRAGGDAAGLYGMVEDARYYNPTQPREKQSRATLKLLLEAASSQPEIARTKPWERASDETWKQAIQVLRDDEQRSN